MAAPNFSTAIIISSGFFSSGNIMEQLLVGFSKITNERSPFTKETLFQPSLFIFSRKKWTKNKPSISPSKESTAVLKVLVSKE